MLFIRNDYGERLVRKALSLHVLSRFLETSKSGTVKAPASIAVEISFPDNFVFPDNLRLHFLR